MTTEPGPAGDDRATAVRNDEAVDRFVERFASLLEEAGLQRMAARVFVALLATDSGHLTSAELAERLNVSPAAISGAVRYLSQVSLVSREREPGTRRDVYRVYDNAWFHALTQRQPLLQQWEEVLANGAEALDPDTPAGRRVAESQEYMSFLRQELAGIRQRWEERRSSKERT